MRHRMAARQSPPPEVPCGHMERIDATYVDVDPVLRRCRVRSCQQPVTNGRPPAPLPIAPAGTEPALPNDNRVAAGRIENGELTIHMEARRGAWSPEGPDG